MPIMRSIRPHQGIGSERYLPLNLGTQAGALRKY